MRRRSTPRHHARASRGPYAGLVPHNGTETGRFPRGVSGNPGGRPRGLARETRTQVGADGEAIITFWLSIMNDETTRTADRLEASRLLAERGCGKPPAQVLEDDPAEHDEWRLEVDRRPTRERMLELDRESGEIGRASCRERV